MPQGTAANNHIDCYPIHADCTRSAAKLEKSVRTWRRLYSRLSNIEPSHRESLIPIHTSAYESVLPRIRVLRLPTSTSAIRGAVQSLSLISCTALCCTKLLPSACFLPYALRLVSSHLVSSSRLLLVCFLYKEVPRRNEQYSSRIEYIHFHTTRRSFPLSSRVRPNRK